MPHFTMARITGLGNLPALLEERAGTRGLIQALTEVDIPVEAVGDRRLHIPLQSMCALFDDAARRVGDRCLGLEVGQTMKPATFGKWLVYAAQAPTLAHALARADVMCHHQVTGARLLLDRRPDVSRWRFVLPNNSDTGPQHTDHLIAPMITFVRSYLGSCWRPTWVEVNYAADPQAAQMEDRLGVPVIFGASSLAIAIPTPLLDARRPSTVQHPRARAVVSPMDVIAERIVDEHRDPNAHIYHVIMLRLAEGRTDLEGVASALGLGLQSVQRRLRQDGTTYRDLLERAKVQRASYLLAETPLSITDIALSLGYSDSTAFSRAFKRCTGQSASAFRRARAAPMALVS
jgi:AraC-like DNA-binding protein